MGGRSLSIFKTLNSFQMQIATVVALLERNGIQPATERVDIHMQRISLSAGCEIGDEFAYLYQNLGGGGWLYKDDFRMLSIREIENVGERQGGEFGRLSTPSSWVALIDLMDGDYVAIDLVSNKILDCDHEELGSARVIANSLTDFFGRFFSTAPQKYWLQPGFVPLEVLVHPHSDELNRYSYRDFWEALGDEQGPELCSTISCGRGRIAMSVKCRKHHYEMVRGHPCPFE